MLYVEYIDKNASIFEFILWKSAYLVHVYRSGKGKTQLKISKDFVRALIIHSADACPLPWTHNIRMPNGPVCPAHHPAASTKGPMLQYLRSVIQWPPHRSFDTLQWNGGDCPDVKC